jgi:hypothetical protein
MNSTKSIQTSTSRKWQFTLDARCLILALGLITASAQAQEWAPSEQLLNLVRKIESADGVMLVGDHGNSRGAYQMGAGAWADVSMWRRARQLSTYEYQTAVWDETVSRVYAANYLTMLHERLAKSMQRAPSCGEVYAAYNMGFTAFARCQFSLAHVNAVTARNCRSIDVAMGKAEPAADPETPVSLTLAAK